MTEQSAHAAQEIRHLKAARAARDQELAEAQKQLEAERCQVEELERNLLSQVGPALTHRLNAPPCINLFRMSRSYMAGGAESVLVGQILD